MAKMTYEEKHLFLLEKIQWTLSSIYYLIACVALACWLSISSEQPSLGLVVLAVFSGFRAVAWFKVSR